MRALALAIICTALAVPTFAAAQWYAPLREGERIQVEYARTGVLTEGRLARAIEDSIWLRVPNYNLDWGFDLRSLEHVRVHRGTRHAIGEHALKGLAYGFAAGATLGLGLALGDREGADYFGGVAGTSAVAGILIGVPSMVIGALTGISVDVWEKVPLPAK